MPSNGPVVDETNSVLRRVLFSYIKEIFDVGEYSLRCYITLGGAITLGVSAKSTKTEILGCK